jgi:hypothetical protein
MVSLNLDQRVSSKMDFTIGSHTTIEGIWQDYEYFNNHHRRQLSFWSRAQPFPHTFTETASLTLALGKAQNIQPDIPCFRHDRSECLHPSRETSRNKGPASMNHLIRIAKCT